MSTSYQYPALTALDAPRNSRLEYKIEVQRLNEINAQLAIDAQGLRERNTYLENLAVSWADMYAVSQRELSNSEAKAENAVTTWFNTRTWLDEAQVSLATTKEQLADASNELTQAKIERRHLEHQLAEQTRATNDALNRGHAAQQEVAALNAKMFNFTARWAELVDRIQKEAIGRQAAEQALHAERLYSQQLREAAKQAIAEAERQQREKDELEADLQLVRSKNEDLVTQMEQVYSYMDQINYDLAEDVNATQPSTFSFSFSSSSTSTSPSPPPMTDSDGTNSTEPSQPGSPYFPSTLRSNPSASTNSPA
ncbi:hypothetical protein BC629DRAFT_1589909 [Irpex lacteus]|nr:hypothetical protein BC629DRAFT_1589909 [Irpex lacteus]